MLFGTGLLVVLTFMFLRQKHSVSPSSYYFPVLQYSTSNQLYNVTVGCISDNMTSNNYLRDSFYNSNNPVV